MTAIVSAITTWNAIGLAGDMPIKWLAAWGAMSPTPLPL
jgi:hypothetical protein